MPEGASRLQRDECFVRVVAMAFFQRLLPRLELFALHHSPRSELNGHDAAVVVSRIVPNVDDEPVRLSCCGGNSRSPR